MSFFRRFLLVPAAFLLPFCLPFLVRGDGPAPPPDPVPLRRVWLPPEGVAREMELARQGLLVKLPRDEFEALVRQAALAEAARKNPPRLVSASYQAQLTDGGLAGSWAWTVIHTAAGPGLLPLTPLNLALQPPPRLLSPNPTLKEPQLTPLNPAPGQPSGSRDAFIGDFDGHKPSLLIDAPGEYSVTAGWSARAEARPEGLQFDLQIPPSPAAVLELDLPPDRFPVVDGGASGPDPANDPNLRKWTIPCGGRSQIALFIRSVDQTPLLRASLETTQVLTPEGLDATYAFNLKSLHQGVRELVFECDPSLRPYDVEAPGLDRWDAAGRLTVHLLAPLDEGTVRIRCAGPLSGPMQGAVPVSWTSPGIRLLQAVNGGETLVLKVHPDLQLANLETGAYRLQEATTETVSPGPTDYQRLTLLGGGLADGGGRPQAQLRPHAVEFRARQLAWWRVDQSALTLQTNYDVTCGRLFQLAVRLPADWKVDSVTLTPDVLLRDKDIRNEWGVRFLIVDLQKALTPADKPGVHGAKLTVTLRPPRPQDVLRKELLFPDAEPIGARFREGALGIGFDEQTHQLKVDTAAVPAPPEDDGPWQNDFPSYYYPYRDLPGVVGPVPAGKLILEPRSPQIRAQCTSDVVLSAGQVSVDTRLLLEAEQGSAEALQSVDLYLSAPAVLAASGDPWNWRAEQGGVEVGGVQRLPLSESVVELTALLSGADPVGGASLLIARPRGECWRVTFSRPLRMHEAVVLHSVLAPRAGQGPLEIPLTAVLGASRFEGETTLHLAAAGPLQVEPVGLREASAAAARPHGPSAWRTFRYNGTAVGLTLIGQLPADDRPPEAIVDWAGLTSYVRADGAMEHHYTFQVSHWSQKTVPLQMPAGARLIAFQVDGVWSPRPPAVKDGLGGPVINLPAPARAGEQEAAVPHRYEIVYTTTAATAGLWMRVEAPAPSLPAPYAPPVVFRRLWRLAPEFSPLGDDRLRRRPGPGEGTPSAAPPIRPEDLFRVGPAAPPLPWPGPANWDLERRAEGLPEVLAGIRSKEPRPGTLGVVLGDAAGALWKRREFLVVDAAALRDAGVDPAAAVTLKPPSAEDQAPPWNDLGVSAISLHGGFLLTTRRQLAAWGETAGAPDAAASAAVEAAQWGRDASGRFQAAAVWAGAPTEEKNPLPSPEMDLAQWTEWEPAPGGGDAPAVVIVRRPLFDAAGWVLTVAFGLPFLALAWRWKRARLALLLCWLAAAGVGLLWLPAALQGLAWPPLLLGCVAAVAWRVGSALRGSAPRSAKARSGLAAAGTAAALLLIAMSGRGGSADPPAPAAATVYIVPGGDDAPDKTFVLAPPELLDQLRTLARPGAGPAAVPISAEYSGEIVGGVAEIDAKFQVLCFPDEATTVALPLDGAPLCRSPKNPDAGEVQVGGKAVKAAALPAPQVGVAVPIRGGASSGASPRVEWVDLHFRPPVAAADGERDVQFTVPRLPQSRLVLRLPKGSGFIQAPGRRGAHNTVKGDPYTLDVDLGGLVAPLHVHWAPEAWLALRPEVQVKEAYLWDLGVDSSRLTALLSYTIGPGGTDSLAVRLPAELEPLTVEARRPQDGASIRLRGWKVAEPWAQRMLIIDFSTLATGKIDVTLELAPRSPWPALFPLPLPAPILPEADANNKPVRPAASYLAYRTRGLNVDRVNPVGVTALTDVKDFAPFWPAATIPDPALPLAYASTLSREDAGRPPLLRLKVRAAATAEAARVDMELHVGSKQADVRAAAVVTAREGGLSLVEWQVRSAQTFTVTGVAGPNVRRWSQDGDRVLAWLEPPAHGDVKLELTGWLPLSTTGGLRLEAPNIRIVSAASQETTLHLIAGGGVALVETGRPNLTHVAPATPLPPTEKGRGEGAGGALTYTAAGREDSGGAWMVQFAPPHVHVYTIVGTSKRRLEFVAVVDVLPVHGGVEALEVRVRNWAGNIDIKVPAGVRQRPLRRGPEEWSWALEQDPGKVGPIRVALRGELPGDVSTGAAPPEVIVPGAGRPVEQWAAIAGTDLTAEPALGLVPVDRLPAEFAPNPAGAAAMGDAAERAADPASLLGQPTLIWKATAPEWRLNLAPHDASSAAPIEVYLAEYRAAPADADHWLHEAVYWLRHDANTDLSLTLPADAEVKSVAIDDDEAAPLQAEPGRLWLPLTGRPAVCQVRVRWRYTAEDFSQPNLERPKLQGAPEGPGLWTVFAPAGWRPEEDNEKTDLHSGLAAAAAASWQRAEALLRVSTALAQQAAEGGGAAALADAQRRFYAECRRAREELEASPDGAAPGWPTGRTPKETLQDLLRRNEELAKERHFASVRADAEAAVEAAGPGRAGAPPAWAAEGRPLYAWSASAAWAPATVLTSRGGPTWSAWTASAVWLALLSLIGLLSLSPSVGAWGRALWPEQIAIVGLIGWWAVGALTLVVFLLLTLWVVGRMGMIVLAVGRLLRTPPARSKSTAQMPALPESSGP